MSNNEPDYKENLYFEPSEIFRVRSKFSTFWIEIGEKKRLDIGICINYLKGEPEIEIDTLEMDDDISYDQMRKMAQLIAEESYRLGKEKKR